MAGQLNVSAGAPAPAPAGMRCGHHEPAPAETRTRATRRPPVLLGRWVPDSPEWLEARRTRLGGSEIAAVVGLSPWESAYSLWMRKAGLLPEKPDTRSMSWGRLLEDVVRRHWLASHPLHHQVHGTIRNPGTWVRDDKPWMLANPDGIVTGPWGRQLLEIKTANAASAWEWGPEGTDEVPPYYLTQTRWYLAVMGLEVCHLAALIGGQDYREYEIKQNADDAEWMIQAGRAFLDSLDAGTPPDIDSSSATYRAVREAHPDIDADATVTINSTLANGYAAAEDAAKAAEAEQRLYRSLLLGAMGTAKTAQTEDGRRVATRTAKKNRDGTPGTPFLLRDRTYTPHKETA